MAIIPIGIDARARIVNVLHEEVGHTGSIPFEAVDFRRNPDGTRDYSFATLRCPVAGCDAATTHPIGGGGWPEIVQRLFVAAALAASPTELPNPPTSLAEARQRVKALVDRQDGPGRWRGE